MAQGELSLGGGWAAIPDRLCFGVPGEEYITYMYTPQTVQVGDECDVECARQEGTISRS
jgi:hypothetical protein